MIKKRIFCLFICIILCIFAGGAYILHTEKKQNEQIEKLSSSVEKLLAQSDKNYNSFTGNCGNHFDYLAIGNSITKHPKCDYWWNEIGMAATSKAYDYFHLVVSRLEKQHGTINSFPINFSNWEIQSTDRSETYTMIEPLLNKDIDLITLQLGENITDTVTLEKDYTELINFIKTNAPNAHIVMVGSFWENSVVENIKKGLRRKPVPRMRISVYYGIRKNIIVALALKFLTKMAGSTL